MAFRPVLKIFPYRTLFNLFAQGEVDVLFGLQENLPVHRELSYAALGESPICCALPENHPLAHREVIQEEELFSQQLIVCTSYTFPKKAMEIQNRIARHISPEKAADLRSSKRDTHPGPHGYGCAILPRPTQWDPELGLCAPGPGAPSLSYGVVYHKKSSNEVLKKFAVTASA